MNYVIANWKLNGTLNFTKRYGEHLNQFLKCRSVSNVATVIICPPFPFLFALSQTCEEKEFFIGAQDCSPFENGPHTGDVSAKMIKDSGASYVIIGHSECRQKTPEEPHNILKKIICAQNAGIKPILCVGESLQERKKGQAVSFVKKQIESALKNCDNLEDILIAYEPVWAIGTGETATLKDIQVMHKEIHSMPLLKGKNIPVLYGGSVNSENTKDIISLAGVQGVLVGGASLKVETFQPIIESVL